MARARHGRTAARGADRPPDATRGALLADLAQRQPLLAVINLAAALLFTCGFAGAAPAMALAGWLGWMVLAQAIRLLCWRRHAAARSCGDIAGWLTATSAASGIGWGLLGLLFAGAGSATQQVLVPFFLAGMAAGAVTSLAGHPPVLCAFLVPTLLPYMLRLALAGEPVALTMSLTTLAYAVGLSAVAWQVHRSLRRSVELHLENGRLVADLERARGSLEELAARRSAELDAVLEAVPVAVWLVHDKEAKRITGNRRGQEMLRVGPGENESMTAPAAERPRHYRILKDGHAVPPDLLPLQRAARGEVVRDEEIRIAFDDGTFFDELISAGPVRNAAGEVIGAVGAGMDITGRKREEDEVRRLALHDALTGLPNRVLLLDRLGQALARARRESDRVAVMLLDLDGFKEVNDTLGHAAGDALLRGVAGRIAARLRASDTLARLGGDEFALVQPGLRAPAEAAALADKILAGFAAPFDLDGQEVQVSASVGVAVHGPGAGEPGPDELLRRADLSLYQAKRAGDGRYRFFEPAMDTEVRARRRLERDLRRALERGEFVLHYQPQFDLATGRLGGVEALVRWRHPERGLVAPGDFIPVAEATGLIGPIGEWVLGEACQQARAWRDAGLTLLMAVNVSPAQLRHGGVLAAVDDALHRHGLEGGSLELEITESLLLEQGEAGTARTLHGLAARGVRLALDDFGTGYSSLAYLRRLPVQRIKIDRSFVRDIGNDLEDEALVRAIVTLGRTLGKQVVAEGVETEIQLAFLRRLGCDAAQGFLLARPRAAIDLGPLLAA